MNLTVYSDYAFRTMMLLAVRAPGTATIQEIAKQYDISREIGRASCRERV